MLFDILAIVTLFTLLITFVGKGAIRPGWLALLVPIMLGLIALRAVGRIYGGSAGHSIRKMFSLLLPMLSFMVLWVSLSARQPATDKGQVFGLLIALFLVVFALYIAIGGFFKDPEGLMWDAPIVFSLMAFVVSLWVNGYVQTNVSFALLVTLLVLFAMRGFFGAKEGRKIGLGYKIAIPIAGLLLLPVVLKNQGIPATSSLSALMALLVLVLAVMMLVKGFKG